MAPAVKRESSGAGLTAAGEVPPPRRGRVVPLPPYSAAIVSPHRYALACAT
ncbi:hypothetical protein CU044_5705 [Streptomyces sp. L-9-10]|nr:hypothetical protein CU044_5705 [Streptomyces sp. L-9-10]